MWIYAYRVQNKLRLTTHPAIWYFISLVFFVLIMIHLKLCYIVYVHWVTKIRSVQFCVCCLGTFGKWMVEHIVLRKKDKVAEVMKIVILKSSLVRYKITTESTIYFSKSMTLYFPVPTSLKLVGGIQSKNTATFTLS